jgi:hypothetical protein
MISGVPYKTSNVKRLSSIRVFSAVGIAITIMIANVPAVRGDTQDLQTIWNEERWIPQGVPYDGPQRWAVWADDWNSDFSSLLSPGLSPSLAERAWTPPRNAIPWICKSMYEGPCANAIAMDYIAVLPPCQNIEAVDCIDSIWVDAAGQRIFGKLNSIFPKTSSVFRVDGKVVSTVDFSGEGTGDDATLPQGAQGSLWQFPGISHSNGDLFYLDSRISGTATRINGKVVRVDNQVSGLIDAVSSVSGNFYQPGLRLDINNINPAFPGYMEGFNPPDKSGNWSCIANDSTACLLRERMPDGLRLGIAIRTKQPLTSWIHGRFSDPLVESNSTPSYSLFKLSADAIKVPYIQDYLSRDVALPLCGILHPTTPFAVCSFTSLPGNIGFADFQAVAPLISPKSAALVSSWRFLSRPSWSLATPGCTPPSKSLVGIVSTNATLYSTEPPKFDSTTQELVYQVAAKHLTPSGSVFLGRYNLTLDAQYARCLWAVGKAPVKATISITGSDQSVATTVMRESKGFVDFSAAGFTFSSPTIAVKLISEQPAIIPTAPMPTPNITQKKITTITCFKGKLSKKVSAVIPKCPYGYKKKLLSN